MQEPRLGIALLSSAHYQATSGSFLPTHDRGLGELPPGWFESPRTWPVPTEYVVPTAASAEAVLRGELPAMRSFSAAVEQIRDRVTLTIADCGFYWAARRYPGLLDNAGRILFSLDLLPVACDVAPGHVVVLTYSAEHAAHLLRDHPLRHRLQLVGLSDLPTWRKVRPDDFVIAGGWTTAGLRAEMCARLVALAHDGAFDAVAAVVLECTILPQFKSDIAGIIGAPTFDAGSVASDMLKTISRGQLATVGNGTGRSRSKSRSNIRVDRMKSPSPL